jgi:integrase
VASTWIRGTPSGRWRACFREPAGRTRTKTFDRKGPARDWLAEQQAAVLRGTFVDPVAGKTRVSTWSERWLDSSFHWRPSTRARVEIALRREILPAFGNWPVAAIGPADVKRLVSGLVASGKAPATVHRSFAVLASMLKAAVEEGLIGRSPCLGVKLPRVTPREMRFVTATELHRLADAVGERFSALVLTCGYVGLRWGELAGLRVGRLRLLERKIDVVETVVEVAGRLIIGPPKTTSRTVTLPRFLVDVLAHHIAAYPDPEGFVFGAVRGGALRRSHFSRRVFAPAVERAEVAPLRLHDLRHTAAALAIASGAHPKVIQERLGHSSIRTTLDVYGHLFPSLEERLADRLDDLLLEAKPNAVDLKTQTRAHVEATIGAKR